MWCPSHEGIPGSEVLMTWRRVALRLSSVKFVRRPRQGPLSPSILLMCVPGVRIYIRRCGNRAANDVVSFFDEDKFGARQRRVRVTWVVCMFVLVADGN